jgi:hypothetical protein
MTTRTVLLYGRSLLLGLVAASLGEVPDLEVTQAGTWHEAGRLLTERVPDVLIFDSADTDPCHVLLLLVEYPRLRLIGLNSESDQAVLLGARETRLLTLDVLKQIVQWEGPMNPD